MVITTVEEAKKALEAASIISGRLEAAHADYEARVAPVKQEYERATKADADEMKTLRADLETFIDTHDENFQKPRKIKTPWGEFGLQSSKQLNITNPDQVISFAKRHGYTGIFEEKVVISKKAVESCIKDGVSVPGAELVCQERPVIKIIPTLPNMAEAAR